MIANNTTLSDFKKISGMNGRIYNFCSQAGIKTLTILCLLFQVLIVEI